MFNMFSSWGLVETITKKWKAWKVCSFMIKYWRMYQVEFMEENFEVKNLKWNGLFQQTM